MDFNVEWINSNRKRERDKTNEQFHRKKMREKKNYQIEAERNAMNAR